MAVRRTHLLFLVTLLVAIGVPARAGEPVSGWAIREVGAGVEHLVTERPEWPLAAHAARIDSAAAVDLVPVLSPEPRPLSELCGSVGAILCVNGDFFSGHQPAGGVVSGGRVLRSFRADHEQGSLLDGRLTTDELRWGGRLVAAIGSADRSHDLALEALNRDPMANEAVLYTSDWGTTTPSQPGQLELVLSVGGPLHPGVTAASPVALRTESGEIPRNGAVVSANGRAAEVIADLWHRWHGGAAGARQLFFETGLSYPAWMSVGGHPVLLRDAQRLPLDPADPMVTGRHPRTLLGQRADGDLLLVAIDGRAPGHSAGATLAEATDLLVELGAVEAINLDGGGSTTFTVACATRGMCVHNRPSDGLERPVSVGLAIVVRPVPSEPLLRAAATGSASDVTVSPPDAVAAPVTNPAPTPASTEAAPTAVPAEASPAAAVDAVDAPHRPAPLPKPLIPITGSQPSKAPAAVIAGTLIVLASGAMGSSRMGTDGRRAIRGRHGGG